jgi:hypothetical protein
MSDIITEIQQYLGRYRSTVSVPIERLTVDDVSLLKGYQLRSPKVQEMDYKRGWAKLAKAQKLNRLMNYHKKLTSDYDLTQAQQNQLKTLFYNSIGNDELDRDQVVYNSNEGSIVNVNGLKQDNDGIFYFNNPSSCLASTPRCTDASNHQTVISKSDATSVIIKFSPVTREQLTNVSKSKPLIKKKIDLTEKI